MGRLNREKIRDILKKYTSLHTANNAFRRKLYTQRKKNSTKFLVCTTTVKMF